MEKRSVASIKREQKRLSPETYAFKIKINELLESKSIEIVYAIKKDLACMTNMPFYKDRPKKIKISYSHKELLIEYMNLFVQHHDKDFIKKLLRSLNRNQAQTIRKVAPKIGKKSAIWEHAIPAKFLVDELVKMIDNNDISQLPKLLELYEIAGQRSLTNEQNQLLTKYRTSMPDDWNWQGENADPLIRHTIVGIKHT